MCLEYPVNLFIVSGRCILIIIKALLREGNHVITNDFQWTIIVSGRSLMYTYIHSGVGISHRLIISGELVDLNSVAYQLTHNLQSMFHQYHCRNVQNSRSFPYPKSKFHTYTMWGNVYIITVKGILHQC